MGAHQRLGHAQLCAFASPAGRGAIHSLHGTLAVGHGESDGGEHRVSPSRDSFRTRRRTQGRKTRVTPSRSSSRSSSGEKKCPGNTLTTKTTSSSLNSSENSRL